MKKSVLYAAAIIALATAPAFAATKSYQVTGPVVAMTADTITILKNGEQWEISKGAAGVPADVKVGSKVTVQYLMTAESVASKPDASAPGLTKSGSSSTGKTASPTASAGAATTAPGSTMQPAMSTGSGTTPTATTTPSE